MPSREEPAATAVGAAEHERPAPGWRADSPGVGDAVMERLQQVGALVRVVEQRLSSALRINPTDLSALEHVISDGPLTATEIADRLRVSTAASTHIVDRLERAGHVTRHSHASDRRKTLVVPDQGSVSRLFEHLAPLLGGVEALVGNLTADERAAVERFLGAVVDLYSASADAIGPVRDSPSAQTRRRD